MRYFHGDFKEACFACVWFCYFIFLSSHKTMLGLSQVKSGLTSVHVAYIGYITCVIKTFVTWDCKLNVPILRCKVMIKSFLYAVIRLQTLHFQLFCHDHKLLTYVCKY